MDREWLRKKFADMLAIELHLDETIVRVWEERLHEIEEYEISTGNKLSQKEFEKRMGLDWKPS